MIQTSILYKQMEEKEKGMKIVKWNEEEEKEDSK